MSVGLLLKAFVMPRTGLKGEATIPRITATRAGVRVGPEALGRYRACCGFLDDGQLPLTFPQMLAGDLHLEILANRGFPLPVAGVVHFQNHIVQHTRLPADGSYDLEAFVEGHRADKRGVLFDIETRMSRAGQPVWAATTTVLSRSREQAQKGASKGKKDGEKREVSPPGLPGAPVRTAIFALPADLGRRYSAIAGDYNPIHLSAVTARPFGFKRAIIHGMWSLARCVAELSDDLPDTPRTCSVRFERPVFLPGRVHFHATRGDVGLSFGLTSTDGQTRHLSGEVAALR